MPQHNELYLLSNQVESVYLLQRHDLSRIPTSWSFRSGKWGGQVARKLLEIARWFQTWHEAIPNVWAMWGVHLSCMTNYWFPIKTTSSMMLVLSFLMTWSRMTLRLRLLANKIAPNFIKSFFTNENRHLSVEIRNTIIYCRFSFPMDHIMHFPSFIDICLLEWTQRRSKQGNNSYYNPTVYSDSACITFSI